MRNGILDRVSTFVTNYVARFDKLPVCSATDRRIECDSLAYGSLILGLRAFLIDLKPPALGLKYNLFDRITIHAILNAIRTLKINTMDDINDVPNGQIKFGVPKTHPSCNFHSQMVASCNVITNEISAKIQSAHKTRIDEQRKK